MKDERKTKRQLIDELTRLRQLLSQEGCQSAEALEAQAQNGFVRQRIEELLRISVEQWYTIFNTMSDAICLLDAQGRIQRCNRAMVELLDRPLGEILDHCYWEAVFGTSEPIDGCPVARMWESLSRESETVLLGDRWFDVSADPLLAEDGQSIGAVYIMTDITERKQAEEAMHVSRRELERTLDATTDGIWTWNFVLDQLTFSPRYYEMLGYAPDEFPATYDSWVALIHPDDRASALAVANDYMKEKPDEYENEFRLRTKDGDYRWIHAKARVVERDEHGQAVYMIGHHEDITERKQAEQALAQQAEQLRTLSARLADAQEAERRRIARELHDQVGQNLTALGINLNILRPHLAQAPESAQSCLDDLLALVKETTSRIRSVMADLRPPELDDYGLLSALRWYADLVGSRTGLAIAVEGEDLNPRLSSRQETSLFRIAQEALTNVVKHAQATQATVTVGAGEELVRMTIVDNGVGFDPAGLEEAGAAPHWGLLTMRERAQAVGAHWRVEPGPGEGTRVVVEMVRSRGGER